MTNQEAIIYIHNNIFNMKVTLETIKPDTDEEIEREIEVEEIAIAALKKQEREKWHPINPDDRTTFPDDDRLIMVSFGNAPVVDIARFRCDASGGAFCPGDEDQTYTRSGIFLNAWRELPERYEGDEDE